MLFRSDRKSTRLNSSHTLISYAVFCLKKKRKAVRARSRSRFAEIAVPDSGIAIPRKDRQRFFFFNDRATPEISTLSLHAALPISGQPAQEPSEVVAGGGSTASMRCCRR